MRKLSPEREQLQARARELAHGEIPARAAEVDGSEQYPWPSVEALRGSGYFVMAVPSSYGRVGRILGEKLPQGRDGLARGDAVE